MTQLKRILLIDDDEDDQVYFRDAVSEIYPDIECRIANNGMEGLKEVDSPAPFDFIFLDLNMPIMNGFECLEQLKNKTSQKEVPVVIFTTSKNSHDIEKSKELGASLYFTKPTSFQILCNKLKEIFSRDLSNTAFII